MNLQDLTNNRYPDNSPAYTFFTSPKIQQLIKSFPESFSNFTLLFNRCVTKNICTPTGEYITKNLSKLYTDKYKKLFSSIYFERDIIISLINCNYRFPLSRSPFLAFSHNDFSSLTPSKAFAMLWHLSIFFWMPQKELPYHIVEMLGKLTPAEINREAKNFYSSLGCEDIYSLFALRFIVCTFFFQYGNKDTAEQLWQDKGFLPLCLCRVLPTNALFSLSEDSTLPFVAILNMSQLLCTLSLLIPSLAIWEKVVPKPAQLIYHSNQLYIQKKVAFSTCLIMPFEPEKAAETLLELNLNHNQWQTLTHFFLNSKSFSKKAYSVKNFPLEAPCLLNAAIKLLPLCPLLALHLLAISCSQRNAINPLQLLVYMVGADRKLALWEHYEAPLRTIFRNFSQAQQDKLLELCRKLFAAEKNDPLLQVTEALIKDAILIEHGIHLWMTNSEDPIHGIFDLSIEKQIASLPFLTWAIHLKKFSCRQRLKILSLFIENNSKEAQEATILVEQLYSQDPGTLLSEYAAAFALCSKIIDFTTEKSVSESFIQLILLLAKENLNKSAAPLAFLKSVISQKHLSCTLCLKVLSIYFENNFKETQEVALLVEQLYKQDPAAFLSEYATAIPVCCKIIDSTADKPVSESFAELFLLLAKNNLNKSTDFSSIREYISLIHRKRFLPHILKRVIQLEQTVLESDSKIKGNIHEWKETILSFLHLIKDIVHNPDPQILIKFLEFVLNDVKTLSDEALYVFDMWLYNILNKEYDDTWEAGRKLFVSLSLDIFNYTKITAKLSMLPKEKLQTILVSLLPQERLFYLLKLFPLDIVDENILQNLTAIALKQAESHKLISEEHAFFLDFLNSWSKTSDNNSLIVASFLNSYCKFVEKFDVVLYQKASSLSESLKPNYTVDSVEKELVADEKTFIKNLKKVVTFLKNQETVLTDIWIKLFLHAKKLKSYDIQYFIGQEFSKKAASQNIAFINKECLASFLQIASTDGNQFCAIFIKYIKKIFRAEDFSIEVWLDYLNALIIHRDFPETVTDEEIFKNSEISLPLLNNLLTRLLDSLHCENFPSISLLIEFWLKNNDVYFVHLSYETLNIFLEKYHQRNKVPSANFLIAIKHFLDTEWVKKRKEQLTQYSNMQIAVIDKLLSRPLPHSILMEIEESLQVINSLIDSYIIAKYYTLWHKSKKPAPELEKVLNNIRQQKIDHVHIGLCFLPFLSLWPPLKSSQARCISSLTVNEFCKNLDYEILELNTIFHLWQGFFLSFTLQDKTIIRALKSVAEKGCDFIVQKIARAAESVELKESLDLICEIKKEDNLLYLGAIEKFFTPFNFLIQSFINEDFIATVYKSVANQLYDLATTTASDYKRKLYLVIFYYLVNHALKSGRIEYITPLEHYFFSPLFFDEKTFVGETKGLFLNIYNKHQKYFKSNQIFAFFTGNIPPNLLKDNIKHKIIESLRILNTKSAKELATRMETFSSTEKWQL